MTPAMIRYIVVVVLLIALYVVLHGCTPVQRYCPPSGWEQLGCYDYAPRAFGPPIIWEFEL